MPLSLSRDEAVTPLDMHVCVYSMFKRAPLCSGRFFPFLYEEFYFGKWHKKQKQSALRRPSGGSATCVAFSCLSNRHLSSSAQSADARLCAWCQQNGGGGSEHGATYCPLMLGDRRQDLRWTEVLGEVYVVIFECLKSLFFFLRINQSIWEAICFAYFVYLALQEEGGQRVPPR